MLTNLKINKLLTTAIFFLLLNSAYAEEEEIYLKSISDQIQVITKDLKTLEKAVYQKSDVSLSQKTNSIKSDGLNEDILTKHLLKLHDIEDQFRELTNKFEEVNFKLDKLSTRVTKIQSDTQLRFSDIESGSIESKKSQVSNLPGSDKFVLAYNATSAKFELIPADTVLTNAAADADLPDSFVNQLDVDLDNKIDLDGGSF